MGEGVGEGADTAAQAVLERERGGHAAFLGHVDVVLRLEHEEAVGAEEEEGGRGGGGKRRRRKERRGRGRGIGVGGAVVIWLRSQ